ncbi:ras and EF-hand domain-containing protein homolog [Nilaparvata lugens]|uniref:ras and EF-hand domain-containing protein homolog n=1 Tax=Nilaparvata lugens TaxID=108931 RepID=UPI00193E6ADB|nr:ras and EF-hand domain-containing protein homolog [Nilaparvata lugens]
MTDPRLEDLFRSCDKKGTGLIGPDEFRELCAGFDIGPADSDAIFEDLDHDGDGKISLNDFAWGFRNFLSLDSENRRLSNEIAQDVSRLSSMRRQSEAHVAWGHLVAGVGEANIDKFLNNSGKKLANLYKELQTVDNCPQLVTHFEGALSSLVEDVKQLHEDNQKLEEMFKRERENHISRLRGLEEELEAQVARVEAQAHEEARNKFDQEKRLLVKKMEAETLELQTHLNLFQKVNKLLTESKRRGRLDSEMPSPAECENLKMLLSDTKANLELVRAEMVQLKSDYERKCKESYSQKELLMEYMNKEDHAHHQLRLLQEANSKLNDTNESLLNVMDRTCVRSPCFSRASSLDSAERKVKRLEKDGMSDCSSGINEYSLRDEEVVPFGIERLIEDIDSGRSTMKDTADCDSYQSKSIKSLQEINLMDRKSQNMCNYDSARSSPTRMDCPQHCTTRANSILLGSTYGDMDPTGPPDRTFKILFAGDSSVGKTNFIHRFCKGLFSKNLGSTVGVDYQVKTIRIDEKNVTLQLWDTAGQERFRSMTRSYFRRSDGVMLLYDVTSERSYVNIRDWMQSIEEISGSRIPIMMCGNKVDVREEAKAEGLRCITEEQGMKLAAQYGSLFVETSSKTGQNIADSLFALTREMLTREDVEVKTSALQVIPGEKNRSCCSKK